MDKNTNQNTWLYWEGFEVERLYTQYKQENPHATDVELIEELVKIYKLVLTPQEPKVPTTVAELTIPLQMSMNFLNMRIGQVKEQRRREEEAKKIEADMNEKYSEQLSKWGDEFYK